MVIDGLSLSDSHLLSLDALCARGADLIVDVGFPTKSLPVQAVLWTGLTAQQLGLGPHNRRTARVPGALPVRFPDSVAVAESWTTIAAAMGFARVVPAPAADRARADHDPAAAAAWAARFPIEAAAAVASPSRLVLVHVLAVDEAAHDGGRRGAAYRDALRSADRVLAGAIAARPDARWIVLADHGHRAAGGHGDAEPALRHVRACVAPRPPGVPATGALHLVDLARHLRDALAVAPAPGAVGRPIAAAIAAPDPDATVPALPAGRAAAALAVLAIAILVTVRLVRPRWTAAWLPVAALAYLAWRGVPTLSSRDALAALTCAAITWIPSILALRHHPRGVIALVIPGAGAALAAAVAAGIPGALLDGTPPAVPYATAVLEVTATVAAGALTIAAGWLAWSATPDSRRRIAAR